MRRVAAFARALLAASLALAGAPPATAQDTRHRAAPRPAPRSAQQTPDFNAMRLFYVTRASWRNDGGVSVFVDLANRRRVGDRVTYYAIYVLERPHPMHGSVGNVAVQMAQITVQCSQRRYRFDQALLVGEYGQPLMQLQGSADYSRLDESIAADVLEIRTICNPPANPPERLVFETLSAALTFARSIRGVET
jgi:hypothetical protein